MPRRPNVLMIVTDQQRRARPAIGLADECVLRIPRRPHGLYSMRLLTTDDDTFIYHTNDIDELYDRRSDPRQLVNRVGDPGCGEVLSQLKRQMIGWMAPAPRA